MSTATLRRHRTCTDAERAVTRLRNAMPDRYVNMVSMHLSFLLDLDSAELESLGNSCLCMSSSSSSATDIHVKRRINTPFKQKKEKSDDLFGTSLTHTHVARIYQLIEFLGRDDHIKAEGLFRKSGNVCRQRLLRERINQNEILALGDDCPFSPHDCATTLKAFLGELPEPLLTDSHYSCHCQIAGYNQSTVTDTEVPTKSSQLSQKRKLNTLQLLFLLLPSENCLLLECILNLLHNVSQTPENKMTSQALGTIFAPHLICSRKLSAVDLCSASSAMGQEVAYMIDKSPDLFTVPRELCTDVARFWRQMENPNRYVDTQLSDLSGIISGSGKKKTRPVSRESIDTVVSFVDRPLSQKEDATMDTQSPKVASADSQVALAQLYAHVQAMPESTRKRKLLKQFNKANGVGVPRSANKHSRSKSLGDALKKHLPAALHKLKRAESHHDDSLHLTQPAIGSSPDDDAADCTPDSLPLISDSPVHPERPPRLHVRTANKPRASRKLAPGSPVVHIVDLNSTPYKTRHPRKRCSSESVEALEESIEKEYSSDPSNDVSFTQTPDRHPSAENEINYIDLKGPPSQKALPRTPEQIGRPIAIVSPIALSMRKASKVTQRSAMTPRSRAPLSLMQGSPACVFSLESSL